MLTPGVESTVGILASCISNGHSSSCNGLRTYSLLCMGKSLLQQVGVYQSFTDFIIY